MFRRHIAARIITGTAQPLGKPSRYTPMVSGKHERAREYRAAADRLREVARQAKDPAVKAELCWLVQSYERLAFGLEQGQEHSAVVDADRSLEIPESPAKSR
jgi:hypothetical protein